MGWFKRRRGATALETRQQPAESPDTPARPAQEVLRTFLELAESMAVLDESRVLAEIEELGRVWGGQAAAGELLEIAAAVVANVQRDQSVRQCDGFRVTSGPDGSHVSVASGMSNREPVSSHRVWRTQDAYHLLSSATDALEPDTMHITVVAPTHRDRVTREYAQELSRKTRDAALDVLAQRCGGEWAKSIKAVISLEGPAVTYRIDGVVLIGTTFAARKREVQSEFEKHWLHAIATTAG